MESDKSGFFKKLFLHWHVKQAIDLVKCFFCTNKIKVADNDHRKVNDGIKINSSTEQD